MARHVDTAIENSRPHVSGGEDRDADALAVGHDEMPERHDHRLGINVLDNAVKYSPCGSKIFIRLQKRNDLVRMEIEDQEEMYRYVNGAENTGTGKYRAECEKCSSA